MANPHRGEVDLVIDDKTFRMAISMQSLALIRQRTGLSLMALGKALEEEANDPDPEKMTAVIWAAIQTYHPDVSYEDVTRMVPAGGIEELVSKMQEVFAAAFPKATGAGNPPKAAKAT